MPFDKKDDSSYMDGVRVKITEKYKRRPVIRMPNSCQNMVPGTAIYEEYDFRLERNVLSKMEEWKKAKEAQTKNREERLKKFRQIEEEGEKLKKLSLEQPAKDANDTQSTCENSSQSAILTPTNAYNISNTNHRPIPSSFNFSDFETDNSSPFDNMELKTINDMEVLASVLSSESTSTGSKPINSLPANNNFLPNKNGVVWDGYNMYSSPQYYAQPSQFSDMYATASYMPEPSYSQATWLGAGNIPMYQNSPLTGARTTTMATPYRYNSVDAPEVDAPLDSRLQSQKSNSKSVPDLVLEQEKELQERQCWEEQRRKTKTPPPRVKPTLSTSAGLENWKPWPDLESPRHIGPDALETLSPSHQLLARQISEMGFPLERTVRTIRKFNGDDKKVIETLIQIQRFEERKFNGDLVEEALHANSYDEMETLKHLEAAVVLLDLGFDNDRVHQVLLECKNNRDAALDRLIS